MYPVEVFQTSTSSVSLHIWSPKIIYSLHRCSLFITKKNSCIFWFKDWSIIIKNSRHPFNAYNYGRSTAVTTWFAWVQTAERTNKRSPAEQGPSVGLGVQAEAHASYRSISLLFLFSYFHDGTQTRNRASFQQFLWLTWFRRALKGGDRTVSAGPKWKVRRSKKKNESQWLKSFSMVESRFSIFKVGLRNGKSIKKKKDLFIKKKKKEIRIWKKNKVFDQRLTSVRQPLSGWHYCRIIESYSNTGCHC